MSGPDGVETAREAGQLAPLLGNPEPSDADAVLRAVVYRKIRENHVGAQVQFSLTATPKLNAQGGIEAAYLLILSMKSPLMSPPRIAAPQLIDDAYPTPEQIERHVRAALQALYDARRSLLSPGSSGGWHPGVN